MKRPAFLRVPDLPRPLWLVLAFAMAMRMAGPFWGMPSSDGWDNDGIAPRDILVGIFQTYKTGVFYIYPPLQHWILAILTLPVTLFTVARLPSYDEAVVVSAFVNAEKAMTAYAVIARLVSLFMSLATIVFLWDWARRAFGERAGLLAAAAVALNQTFTYYGQTSNLDGPALFWIAWTLRELSLGKPRLRKAFLLGACAVATKDQAYAALILPMLWVIVRRTAKAEPSERGSETRNLLLDAFVGLAFLLLVDGAITNPTGFRARILMLRGPASQEHAFYSANIEGWIMIGSDLLLLSERNYPYLLAPFLALGLVRIPTGPKGTAFLRALPFVSALSFFVFFNLAARRTEHRFLMPEGVFLGVYYGVGLDWLLARTEGPRRRIARYAVLVFLAPGLFFGLRAVVTVPLALFDDPRYQAEALLERLVQPGDKVELYGRQVYLPRIPSRAKVMRLDTSDPKARGTMPNYEELPGDFAAVETRKPRFLVVSEGWVWAYRKPPPWDHGRKVQAARAETFSDEVSRKYVESLFEDRTAYRCIYFSREHAPKFWQVPEIHLSTNTPLWIFERKER